MTIYFLSLIAVVVGKVAAVGIVAFVMVMAVLKLLGIHLFGAPQDFTGAAVRHAPHLFDPDVIATECSIDVTDVSGPQRFMTGVVGIKRVHVNSESK